jgi:hypothetical protein
MSAPDVRGVRLSFVRCRFSVEGDRTTGHADVRDVHQHGSHETINSHHDDKKFRSESDRDMKEKPDRRRCDARTRRSIAARDRAFRAGGLPRLRKLMGSIRCRNWALPASKRCRLHGGLSTGPVTAEGKARTAAATKAGRARWLAKLKAEGKPIPFGRKKGGHNRPIAEREQAAYEKRCASEGRDALRQSRIGSKVRRSERRQDRKRAADDAVRFERFRRGEPFWTDEEWEAL